MILQYICNSNHQDIYLKHIQIFGQLYLNKVGEKTENKADMIYIISCKKVGIIKYTN